MDISQQDIEEFERPGPRYTSYPPVPFWQSDFDPEDFKQSLGQLTSLHTLSLYVHLPFCIRLCHFCACTKIIDPQRKKGSFYLTHLRREIASISSLISDHPEVVQLSLGGGTPTYYSAEDLKGLVLDLKSRFRFGPGAELSVEANPVVTRLEHLEALRESGFNRLSFGVQDFDLEVQSIINRDQSFEQTRDLIVAARNLGFESINTDLIYGLPLQSIATIQDTIEKVSELRPDRIALYSYAKVPWKHPFQRRFQDDDLPSGLKKIALYREARRLLEESGYEAIGMDHFALSHDELFEARRDKKLHRNFMGYTTKPSAQMIGFGVSAISMLSDIYCQNLKSLSRYQRANDHDQSGDHFVFERGIRLTKDHKIRRDLIMGLLCNFSISYEYFMNRYDIVFQDYFSNELKILKSFESKGLLELNLLDITILPRGQILIRNIVMVFDTTLPPDEAQRLYSLTV